MSDRRIDQLSIPRELSESPLFCSPNMDDDSDLELDDANAFELDTDLVKPKSKFDPARSFTLPPGWDDISDSEEEQAKVETCEEDHEESGEEVEEQAKDDLEVCTPPLNGTPWRFTREEAASTLSSIALAEAKPFVIKPTDLGAAFARRSETLARDAAEEFSKQGPPKKPEAIQDPDETESEYSDSEEEQPWGFAYQGYAWRDDPRAKYLTVEQVQAQMDAEKEDAPRIRRQAENLGDVVRQCKERRERRAARKAAKGKKKEMSRRWAPY